VGHARSPPISNEIWQSAVDDLLTSETRAILHTDGAKAYAAVRHEGPLIICMWSASLIFTGSFSKTGGVQVFVNRSWSY
jgi:hypothetical protein